MTVYYSSDTSSDILSGTEYSDIFYSSLYDDMFFGNGGNDTFVVNGIANANSYYGGTGYDTLVADSVSAYQTYMALEINYMTGIEEIRRNVSHKDTFIHIAVQSSTSDGFIDLQSVALVNIDGVRGSFSNDNIYLSQGDDFVDGRAGNDQMTGYAGDDTFHFELWYGGDFGHDTITDFSVGDVLEFKSDIFSDSASVLAAAAQVGADTVITYNANNTITLENVALSSLGADDFAFV